MLLRVYVCVALVVLNFNKLWFKLPLALPAQGTVRQIWCNRPSQLAHKSYAKALRCLFFHVRGLLRHRVGKSVGRRRLALRVHRVLFIPQRARSLSFYGNSSAFCAMPV